MKIQGIDVGNRIRTQRKRRKLSLNQLADMTGIAASNLSSIELNKSSPTLGTLAKIADAFGMKISAFVEEIYYEKISLCTPEPTERAGKMATDVSEAILTGKLSVNSMEASVLGLETGAEFLTGEGTERLIYCIEGQLEVNSGADHYEVRKNAGIYLMPEISAVVSNKSRSVSKALIVSQNLSAQRS